MAMLTPAGSEDDELLTQINTTPLVDVMLVLLIIFLITIPAVTASINVGLPKENQRPYALQPDLLTLMVDATGKTYLQNVLVQNDKELEEKLRSYAQEQPLREVQIAGDAKTEFRAVGRIMHLAKAAGLKKIHFMTEPGMEGVR